MADKKQPRSLETAAGMPIQHLKEVGVAQMDDNIVEVIPGIFGEIQPTGCIISTLTKNSRGYANKRLRINGEWKTLTVHRLVLENILERPIRPEYLACHTCDVRNCINPNHLWEGSRLENSQDRFKKGRIKDVGSTSAPKPQKQLRGQEIIPGIRAQIQPNGCMICTLAKRSDGYAIKATRINGKTKSLYAHRLVLEHKLVRPVKPGYFACHSCDDRGCVNPDHLWEGTPADNSRDAIEKNRFPFVPGKICPNRKLKAEQVQQIRYLLSEGISKAKIARTFAISRSQIILLARGEIYRDLL
ncbi:helix-turn-helix domain-containing protein [Microcoleus vaginatus]|uniref:helix-turn-helix domain-containing protein n=1 Tax=Microcoleus vaginatus TaxID=119532 RepID=UPI0032AE5776